MEICPCLIKPGYWKRADVRPLTLDELLWAERVADARNRSYDRKQRDSSGRTGRTHASARRADIIGAEGELAFCVFWGIPWPATVEDYGVIDVAPGSDMAMFLPPRVQVKTRDLSNSSRFYNMIVKPRDLKKRHAKDTMFVCMHQVDVGTYAMMGFAWGDECARFPTSKPGGWDPVHEISVDSMHRFPLYGQIPKKHIRGGVNSNAAHTLSPGR